MMSIAKQMNIVVILRTHVPILNLEEDKLGAN